MLRRNIIIIFMCLELMLNAANLSLVAFSRFNLDARGTPNYNAQVLVFFIITVAAAEVAVGLAIIVALYRAKQTVQRQRHQQAAILTDAPVSQFRFHAPLPWIILFSPLVAALLILLFTRGSGLERVPEVAAVAVSFSGSCLLFLGPDRCHIRSSRGSIFTLLLVNFGASIDALSQTMLIVVTGVGLLVHIYSLGYMHEDRDMARYFAGCRCSCSRCWASCWPTTS